MEHHLILYSVHYRKNKKYDRIFLISDMQGGDSIVKIQTTKHKINLVNHIFIQLILLIRNNNVQTK